MRAFIGIPPLEDYPHAAVRAGIAALGHECVTGPTPDADYLVVWSPWNGSHRQALQRHFERAGKPVIVMENGWLSPIGKTDYFQVALGGWNGSGSFLEGGQERWAAWSVPLAPWHEGGLHDLVIGQRGHPSDTRTAPPDWHMKLPVAADNVVRRARASLRPLAADLARARVCHTWSSNAASHALVAGVPVIRYGPQLMVAALASLPGEPLFRGDRVPEFERLAWAQWTKPEIQSGAPFARLLP